MKISLLDQSDINKLPFIQPPTWYDIRPIHEFYFQASYCYTYKVELGNEMVGAGTVIIHDDVAWLAHILVHENHRKKGIGRAISEYVLNVALNQGIKTVYLKATDLGTPIYAKIGFEVETEYLIYKEFTIDTNPPTDTHIQSYKSEYMEDVLALDKRISGENRIDDLHSYLKSAFVYLNNKTIEGVYFPECGEGLIIAENARAGTALMYKRLQAKDVVLFPQENTNAKAFMDGLNIKPKGRIKRMIYGERRPTQLSGIYNRIGGNLG